MSTKTKIFRSQIFSVGTKFVVSENSLDGTFSPGTEGFISYVRGRDRDYPNVVFLKTVITKRGKSGKERLDQGEISTPIFDLDSKAMSEILPDKKRKYFVHISPVESQCSSILEMSDIDYLAWANAYAMFLYQLNSRSQYISIWPEDSSDVVNKLLNIEEYYNEDPDFIKAEYGNDERRCSSLHKMRLMESNLVKCYISYKQKTAKLEEAAITDILKRSSDLDLGPQSIIKASQKEYSSKKSIMDLLIMCHGGKHKEHKNNLNVVNKKLSSLVSNGLSS
jgi:hypothetical protein